MAIDKKIPLNAYNPHSLRIRSTTKSSTPIGVSNPGFWGVNANVSVYHLSLWVRSTTIKTIDISLTTADGNKKYSSGSISGITGQWKKFSIDLSLTPTNDSQAQFIFMWQSTGSIDSVYFDVVTAFPDDGWMGLPYVRADLVSKLAALHPAFVRFPGGCVVEGDDLVNRFNWKNALGPLEERAGHWDLWNYWSEDGLGLFEYLSIIEKFTDIYGNPTRAIWVINNGISHGQSLDPEQVVPYIDDALDSLEFAMGSTDSEWGSVRSDMGHPEPFKISFVAIGNEDCGKPFYNENYQLFYDAIQSKYPTIKLISNCDPNSIKGQPVQLWDYHIYTSAPQLAAMQNTFDDPAWRNSESKIFNSEYAVTDGAGMGNLLAALGEAAWMTGVERNSDVVTLASYAPLFVNINGYAWLPGAIIFDSENSFGIPSYWNQFIWANSFAGLVNGSVKTLTNSLSSGLSNVSVAVSIGEAQTGGIVLIHKLVNIKNAVESLLVTVKNLPSNAKLNPVFDVVTLSGPDPEGENSFSDPMAISPVSWQLNVAGPTFEVTLPPWSVMIVRAYASTS